MRTNLIKPKNISEAKSKTSNDGMLDMVIAFDTTGSMAGCIRSVKEYVTELVPKLFAVNPNLRLGVVAFGDYKDTGERLVNINTISQLIYNGVKYTVEQLCKEE